MSLFDFLKPASPKPEIEDSKVVKKMYRYWRIRVFYAMYMGYALFYVTRKSFTFAMPYLMDDLGFTKAQLGIIGSMLYITYGISKFVSGVISDKSNPKYFMGLALLLTGVFNIFFGLSSSIFLFALLWGLNGWAQGGGWPPCAKLLTHWYAQSERGTWWGVWNTSHNVGAAIIPIIVVFASTWVGWRFGMFIPGVLAILGGLFLMNRLADTPRSLGLPTIEAFKQEMPKEDSDRHERDLTTKEILIRYVLTNKYIWILGVAYFFVYIIRTAINDWTLPFLIEDKKLSDEFAGLAIFWFEIGGFFGSLVAGWASDFFFKGRRGPVNVIFSFLASGAVIGMYLIPPGFIFLQYVMVFLVGFMIFGPQMLIGMAAAELSHVNAAGAATGFIGCFAYLGAAFTGFPVGLITDLYGWYGFFTLMAACGLIAVLCLAPLWRLKERPDVNKP